MKKRKGKVIRNAICAVFLLCFFFMAIFIINNNKVKVTGAPADAYMKFPGFDPSYPEGSEKNPFIILEIVPHRSIGQIGYVVKGQEPVDMALIQADNKWGEVIGVAQDSFYIDDDGPYDYKNLDIFRNEILMVEEDYHVRVVTITPEVLNENTEKFSKYYDLDDNGKNNKVISGADSDDEIDLIAHADLISISPMAHAGSPLVDLWNSYGRDTSGASSHKTSFKDVGNDLSWQTTMELFMKVGIVKEKAPLVYDYRIMTTSDVSETIGSAKAINFTNETGTGYSSNIYKLCLMLQQYDPEVFYDMYLNPDGVTGGAMIVEGNDYGRSTGSIVLLDDSNNPKPPSQQLPADSSIYWGEHTFLPKNPFGPPLSNVGSSALYQQYLIENNIIFSYVAGTYQYHDAVIRNVYHYNGGSSIVQVFNNSSRDDLCVKDDNDGYGIDFNQDFFDWLQEERYGGIRPTKATPKDAIEYILNLSRMNREVRILELQPCRDFSLTREAVRLMFPGITGTIVIDQQTTAEFIGKLDDLNSTYDMIYIGANTGTMNTDAYGKTVYNDPALDGLIYLHVGDRMVAFDALNGAMRDSAGNIIKARSRISGSKSDIMKGLTSGPGSGLNITTGSIDFYRFSGNDISYLKYSKLKDFVKTGYPVIFDEKLLDSSDEWKINRNLVDDSSYIYRFLQEGLNNLEVNIIPTSRIEDNLSWIKNLLKKSRLSVTMINAPKDYTGEESSRIIGRQLSFTFRINKHANTDDSVKYNWEIYVDNNADGKYSPEELLRYGTNAPHSTDIPIIQSLPDEDYADVIPWLLKVSEVGNNAMRTQVEGMAAFRQANDDRIKIYVLQITSDNSTIHLENLLNPSPGRTTLFYEYTKDLKDFSLEVETITVSEFLNMYKPYAPYNGIVFDPFDPQGTSSFIIEVDGERKYYDMLIFGFGDCYTDIDNTYHALDDITHYIQTGRSVMFTHDTTSFVNMEQSSFIPLSYGLTFWGYGINQYFRNTLGLDRYGMMRSPGDTTQYDIALMPSQAKNIYGGTSTYPELHGFSYPVLMAFGNPGSGSNINPLADRIYDANKDYPVFSIGTEFKAGSNISAYHTRRVTKVNEGQITSYPYVIPDEFTIGNSHAQYYELNMEDDDITVWYCLSDDDPAGNGPYSVSPNDVRNNYYIYNKRNIMYTVVGHETIDTEYVPAAGSPYDEYEVKLFINCMIASYQAGLQGPIIEITNTDARMNTAGEYLMMANKDQFESIEVPAPTKTVFFKPKDPNLSLSELSIKIYRYDALGDVILIKPDVYIKDTAMPAPDSADGEGYMVEPEVEYFFELPLGASSDYYNGKASIYISVKNEDKNLMGGTKASIIPLNLFDLD